MTWEELDDIIFDGTEDEIKRIRCPECGSRIQYKLENNSFNVYCSGCYTKIHYDKPYKVPNCVNVLGTQAMI